MRLPDPIHHPMTTRTTMTNPIFHRISKTTVILQQCHEVLFKDDSTIALHLVEQHGLVHQYLRCLVSEGMHAIMFDLRDLSSQLGPEIPRSLAHDVPLRVAIMLRQKYASATELSAAVFGVSRLAVLLPEVDAPLQQARLFQPAPLSAAIAHPREWAQ